ncbi:MAG: hypothetical protein ACOYB8_03710 [Eubacteriaceae bacterium]|jgi:hypothetical protein
MSRNGISIKTVQRSHLEDIVCRHENKARQKSRIYQIRETLKREEKETYNVSSSGKTPDNMK